MNRDEIGWGLFGLSAEEVEGDTAEEECQRDADNMELNGFCLFEGEREIMREKKREREGMMTFFTRNKRERTNRVSLRILHLRIW